MALVITRKLGATVEIKCPDGQSIFINPRSLGSKNVSLGITAPKEYLILRDNAKAKEAKVQE